MWGAYHFGVGFDGSDQANFFLSTVKPDAQTLIVLDYEPNVAGRTMALNEAREFVDHTQQALQRFPGLDSGHLIKEQLGHQTTPDPILANCFLWIAQYNGPKLLNVPPTFKTRTFWQHTDGMHGADPHTVKGIGQCDRDQLGGTLAQLHRLWGVGAKAQAETPK